jgi:hypothetical protein
VPLIKKNEGSWENIFEKLLTNDLRSFSRWGCVIVAEVLSFLIYFLQVRHSNFNFERKNVVIFCVNSSPQTFLQTKEERSRRSNNGFFERYPPIISYFVPSRNDLAYFG